jgi:3-oxoacyl-[acyl-carrier-protein] synthase II
MSSPNGRRVAITGLGFMTPLGADGDTVWSNLVRGISPVGPITHFDPSRNATKIAAEVKDFVPEDYMDGKAARNASRYTQFAVAASLKALADAGLDPAKMDPSDVGVVISSVYGGIIDAERAQVVIREGAGYERVSPHAAAMVAPNMAAAVVAMNVRAGGINYAVSSACASGANGIGEAAEIVRRGDAKVMIAGGSEASITPLVISMYDRIRATSNRNDDPARASRPWDTGRDGFVHAEGSVILILEDWEHAQQRGAHIRAEMAGYGASIDMRHFTSPDPAGAGAARSMLMAVRKAGLQPEDVDYVNAHATSTRQGDLAETNAIKRAFNGHATKLAVSSTKSVHGHLIGAAGAMEAAVCVLALERGMIPPTINLQDQDPECDLDYVPNHPRPADIRVAISNSFGLGGHNATLLIRRFDNGSAKGKMTATKSPA